MVEPHLNTLSTVRPPQEGHFSSDPNDAFKCKITDIKITSILRPLSSVPVVFYCISQSIEHLYHQYPWQGQAQ